MAKTNLDLWKKVERTNPEFLTDINLGRRNFSAICAQYQRKNATEQFGPMGKGWGVQNVKITFQESIGDGGTPQRIALYQAELWWGNREQSFPICSTIKWAGSRFDKFKNVYVPFVDDDWAKKVATDALTKGLSMLGFNSDVFEGKFEDSKYKAAMSQEFANGEENTMPQAPKPEGLDTFKSALEQTARKGGSNAVRKMIAGATQGNPLEQSCMTYIRNTSSESQWLQGHIKGICDEWKKEHDEPGVGS